MKTEQQARALRAGGLRLNSISEKLGISLAHAYRCARGVEPCAPRETGSTIIKYHADGDGYPQPIRMPRIPALHGDFSPR